MSSIKKAIIPAAGLGTRFLPATISCPKEMLTIVDKPVIQYIVEEAVKAGIEDILIVTRPGKEIIKNHFYPSKDLLKVLKKKNKITEIGILENISNLANISFVFQEEQKGLADAVYCGKKFANDDSFAVLLGDTIIRGTGLDQLVKIYEEFHNNCVLVQYLDNIDDVKKYGVIKPISDCPDLTKSNIKYFKVMDLIEKPGIDEAPSRYAVASRYIFKPEIFSLIEKVQPGLGGELQITDSMRLLSQNNDMIAAVADGPKYDIGGKLDFIKANLDFALEDPDIKEKIYKHLKQKVK